ncbi:BMP family protein [Clostridia bacterium]|nr:BMP family protein [Clostridia bacterium]
MLFTVVGCGGGDAEEPVEEPGEEPVEEPMDVPSVALLLPGPINDMGWNASAYSGLKLIEDNYGADVSYTESVGQSDMEEVFRSYASIGYDMIFGHGSQFTDAAVAVAAEFPDTMFILVNGNAPTEPNLACVQVADEQQGFLMGAFAALMTETGTIGVIGGQEIPPITNAVAGFIAGAEYVAPDVEVLSSMTGSFDDVNAAKETALAFIDSGADYVGAIANQAGLGSIEACEERGVYAIGANQDQFDISPDSVVVSVLKEVPIAFDFAYKTFIDGNLKAEVYRLGVKEGVVFFSSYHDFEDFVPQEVKDRMAEVEAELSAGNIEF